MGGTTQRRSGSGSRRKGPGRPKKKSVLVPPFGRSVGRSSDGVRFVPPPSPLLPPGERTLPLLVVEVVVVVAEVRGGGREKRRTERPILLLLPRTLSISPAALSLLLSVCLPQAKQTKAAQEEIREFESSEEEK